MSEYYACSKMIKVKLLAENGIYEIKDGKKILLSTVPSIERLFLYYVYVIEDVGEVAEWLRSCLDKNITPMKIDKIVNIFIDSHPIEKIDDFKFEDTPVYATEEHGLQLPLPGDCCTISLEHERELIKLIVKHPNDCFGYLKSWFENFRDRYGLHYPKMKNLDVDHEMVVSFLNQHGYTVQKNQQNKSNGLDVMEAFIAIFGFRLDREHERGAFDVFAILFGVALGVIIIVMSAYFIYAMLFVR